MLAAECCGVLDRPADAVLELALAAGKSPDPALALVPVASGQVAQNLNQIVAAERLDQALLREGVGEKILHAPEAIRRRGREPVEEIVLVVEHGEIGREIRHGWSSLGGSRLGPYDRAGNAPPLMQGMRP